MANMLYKWLFVAALGLVHPFFVSMTEFNYNGKDKDLEISVRIFTDDFENTIRKYHPGVKIDILHPANQEQMNQFVSDYIQKHLQLQLNGKPVTLSFVGYEQQSESIWSYFEVKNVTGVQKLDVTNNLLHDYNTNQINMMHIKVGDKEESYKLDYPDSKTTFNF
ncbi:MAG TPA: DUF6702 family protein [Chitinophagaceae bacterium]|nr:DUF6702 family protein [Chitinophagaceae bacterium]